MRNLRAVIKQASSKFGTDDCMTLAAALAFYTLFALPPLLFLLVAVVSVGMSAALEQDMAREQARKYLQMQASNLISNNAAAHEVGNIIDRAQHQGGALWKSLLSLVGVLVAATGLVSSLQASLNRVWEVKPATASFARQFLWKRTVSLTMILGFGFVLLVSFVLSTILTAMSDFAASKIGLEVSLTNALNQSVTLVMTWFCFTAILRFMPDAHVPWRHAFCGGLLTLVLFTLGRLALFFYLKNADPAEQLGSAAGSLVVILLWVYYSSATLLIGAEFTAAMSSSSAKPEQGAVRVEEVFVSSTSEKSG